MTVQKLTELNDLKSEIDKVSSEIVKCNQIAGKKLYDNIRFFGSDQQECDLQPPLADCKTMISTYKAACVKKLAELQAKFDLM